MPRFSVRSVRILGLIFNLRAIALTYCLRDLICKAIFQVPYGDVMTKTLVFAVYDYDRFSKHDAIGEVRLPVCQMDLAQAKEIWKDLSSIVGDGKVS